MESLRKLDRQIESIGWGMVFLWWGVTELLGFLPRGTGAAGLGLILLGLNVARSRYSLPVNGLTTTLGILALVLGGLELAGPLLHLPFELPVLAIVLIVLGVIIIVGQRPWLRSE
jgi:hypothetical protein